MPSATQVLHGASFRTGPSRWSFGLSCGLSWGGQLAVLISYGLGCQGYRNRELNAVDGLFLGRLRGFRRKHLNAKTCSHPCGLRDGHSHVELDLSYGAVGVHGPEKLLTFVPLLNPDFRLAVVLLPMRSVVTP